MTKINERFYRIQNDEGVMVVILHTRRAIIEMTIFMIAWHVCDSLTIQNDTNASNIYCV